MLIPLTYHPYLGIETKIELVEAKYRSSPDLRYKPWEYTTSRQRPQRRTAWAMTHYSRESKMFLNDYFKEMILNKVIPFIHMWHHVMRSKACLFFKWCNLWREWNSTFFFSYGKTWLSWSESIAHAITTTTTTHSQ